LHIYRVILMHLSRNILRIARLASKVPFLSILSELAGRVPSLRKRPQEEPSDVDVEPVEMGTEETDNLDSAVYNYILSKDGAIVVGKASEELGVHADRVKEAIERLEEQGRVKPY
jgi:hypothetical protein